MKVPVFFLHAEFDLRNMVDGDAPDRDCVHTVGPPKPLPPQVGSLHNPKTFENMLIHEAIDLIRWLCARERCTTPSWSQSRATPLGLALEQFFRYSNGIEWYVQNTIKIFWEVNLTSCDRTGAGLSRAGFTGSGRPGLGGASGPRRRRRANMGRWDWTLGWGDYNNLLAIRLKCNATLFQCNVTFLECKATFLKCKATLLKCNATLSKCNATFLECDATLLESSGGLDWAREWGQTTWSGDTHALSLTSRLVIISSSSFQYSTLNSFLLTISL